MTIVVEGPGGSCRVEGSMTICEAVEDRAVLLEALARAPRLEVDLSGVTEMDTAGLQLLVLLRRAAEADGKAMRVVAHSGATREVVERFNIPELLGREAP